MANILLVEDDAIVQHVHQLMLTKLGHHVHMTLTGQETLHCLRESHSFNLIFVDLGLPDMNGIDLIKEIRLISTIPVIALTGYLTQLDQHACLAAGAAEVAHKPIGMEDLKNLLNKYL